ncbi:two-component system histidine kinase PnpS [Macrococcoides caseolyticum]|uniref:two-component system histidine kinase PnpS n=1 Tax=Macrococcoides caseolyticum TaxID=69966 RepID=UPI000C33DF4A|nr:HAMP domain-containing sensor histidine kinase [Macrococcus caseolyticus]PKE13280.1 PAS domain-containing sensor histidine kinase [Macrococcus caseolyticus]PKE48374.1 PAS domain-containing sensor histidine kinase [Macrococcus caseolyticus]PKF15356.1 PAS domain-containing sensor histidine kinase [Macrococcus caseolyticus]PNZ71011.1 PAS domain-containing sensor histidine kinase [Macrococcus caseolyticus]QPT46878.1 PAS domain-containing protein [Macrococcus caseolyticus]
MISFQRKLLIMLTTMIVVSFLLVGMFITTSISNDMKVSMKRTMAQDAKIIQSLAEHQDFNMIAATFDDQRSYQILVMEGNKPLYVTQGFSPEYFETALSRYTAGESEANEFRYDSEDKQSILKMTKKDTVIYLIQENRILTILSRSIWKYIGLMLLIMLPILYFIVRYINKSYIQPIKEVTYASKLLANGNYKVRVPESNVTETKDLFISMNILARTLQDFMNEQKLQRNRLETTLQNIPSATLLVNNYGEVVIANETFLNFFNRGNKIKKAHYDTVIAHKDLKRMIKEAIATEKPINETIEHNVNVHKKYFDVAVVPVLSKKRKRIEGIVIVLHDITQLKTLEQMRKDFVANVSHELKTPITSIKGFTETLLDGAKEDKDTLEMFLDIILKESNRIQVLVSELLELSKIEQADHFNMVKVNLPQKVFNSVEVVYPLAEKKNIKFNLELEKNLFVLAEPSKLKQVMINLLSNAINYSPEDAEVTVKAYLKADECIVEIIDQGIGIAPEETTRIFERFYRVDKARSRDSGGTGLGLAIVKHIIEVFNGEIDVESELGKGSTFRIKLKQFLY